MVYYDYRDNWIKFDEQLLIEYISKRHLLENEGVIKNAEIHATIIPFDIVTTYVVRLHYIRNGEDTMIEGYVDVDSFRFKNFLRKNKIKKIISSVLPSF